MATSRTSDNATCATTRTLLPMILVRVVSASSEVFSAGTSDALRLWRTGATPKMAALDDRREQAEQQHTLVQVRRDHDLVGGRYRLQKADSDIREYESERGSPGAPGAGFPSTADARAARG